MRRFVVCFLTVMFVLGCAGAVAEVVEGYLSAELDGIEAKAYITQKGEYCIFITNNMGKIIDELDATIYFYDAAGQIIDFKGDGHDMFLPDHTVVSNIKRLPKEYATAKLELEYELGANPSYKNHSADIEITANEGNDNLIVQITNNGKYEIREIEYVVVYYMGDDIVFVGPANDVYDVGPGKTVIEKEIIPKNYDRYEIYLNQAHTFN